MRSPEVFNNASFILPLSYIANTFVQSEKLPTLLRHFAERNPVRQIFVPLVNHQHKRAVAH